MPISSHKKLPVLAAIAAVSALAFPGAAEAFSPFLVVPDPAVAEATPAYRYANMTDAEAFAELDQRHILFTKLGVVSGVRAPIRLTGRLHGVYIHSSLPPDQRVTSPFEILDARLALALDDFAAVLERHDIDEVVHFTMYRPNVANTAGSDHGGVDDLPDAAHPPHKGASARLEPAHRGGLGLGRGAGRKAPATASKLPALGPKSAAAQPQHGAKQKTGPAGGAKTLETLSAPPPVVKGAPKSAPHASGRALHAAAPHGAHSAAVAPHADPSQLHTMGPQAAPNPADSRQLHTMGPQAAPNPADSRQLHTMGPQAAPNPADSRQLHTMGPQAAPNPADSRRLHKTTWAPPGTRHPAGLAIDVGLLHKKSGAWISIASHFHGHIGDRTCGESAHVPEEPEARELRALVCESSDLGVFTYVLTPDFNAAHADHFHMEIKPGVRWFLYH